MDVPITLPDIPEDEKIIAVMSIRIRPDGRFALQVHHLNSEVEAKINAGAVARAMRWYADLIEIDAIETTE